MRTVGIVCEFNPFHRGHLYLIEELRRRIGSETTVVCAMSGDFVQRGEAAVFDKFTRAEAACRCGADLVLELPLPWCLSSAEGFASCAIAMLTAAGCDTIAFGSESGEENALERLAAFSLDPLMLAAVYRLMDADDTLSFARARQQTAAETLGPVAALLSDPNDILAVEYIKAIKKSGAAMSTLAVRRRGSRHDSLDGEGFCSAMQLRKRIERGEAFSAAVPPEAMAAYTRENEAGRVIDRARLEIAILSRLCSKVPADFERLPDAGGGAGARLFKAIRAGGTLEEIARDATAKRYTTARMRRMLLCAALGISQEDTEGGPPWLRVLAADEKGRALLHGRRDAPELPIITKPAAVRMLDERSQHLFDLGSQAHDLYSLCCTGSSGFKPDQDWRTAPSIV